MNLTHLIQHLLDQRGIDWIDLYPAFRTVHNEVLFLKCEADDSLELFVHKFGLHSIIKSSIVIGVHPEGILIVKHRWINLKEGFLDLNAADPQFLENFEKLVLGYLDEKPEKRLPPQSRQEADVGDVAR